MFSGGTTKRTSEPFTFEMRGKLIPPTHEIKLSTVNSLFDSWPHPDVVEIRTGFGVVRVVKK